MMTALMRAAMSGNREAVDTLLRLGADPDILSSRGSFLLRIVDYFLGYGRPALHMAIQAGDLVITERLAQITTKGEAHGGN